MSTERKILANLAWRVHKARHSVRRRFSYIGTDKAHIYHSCCVEWGVLHSAFNAAKQIYFDNQPQD